MHGRVGAIDAWRSNALLGHLDQDDRALLSPHLRSVALDDRAVLFEKGDLIRTIYFPEVAVVSFEEERENGDRVEVAIVGAEGVVGWPALLGCERATNRAVLCLQSSRLLEIETADMLAACRRSSTLWLTLLRFVEVMSVQMNRLIVSTLCDTVQRRLARWLLMRQDRIGGVEIRARHDEVSANLNVRRASVTDALHILEGDRLVRCFRGRILIRDRDALVALAGDGYGLPEALYRQLVGPTPCA